MKAKININIQLSFTNQNLKGKTFKIIEKSGNRTTLDIYGRTVDFYGDEITEIQPVETTQTGDKMKEYRFEVEYEHKGRANGFALTETKVRAKSYDEALKKVRKNFKNIFEISEA